MFEIQSCQTGNEEIWPPISRVCARSLQSETDEPQFHFSLCDVPADAAAWKLKRREVYPDRQPVCEVKIKGLFHFFYTWRSVYWARSELNLSKFIQWRVVFTMQRAVILLLWYKRRWSGFVLCSVTVCRCGKHRLQPLSSQLSLVKPEAPLSSLSVRGVMTFVFSWRPFVIFSTERRRWQLTRRRSWFQVHQKPVGTCLWAEGFSGWMLRQHFPSETPQKDLNSNRRLWLYKPSQVSNENISSFVFIRLSQILTPKHYGVSQCCPQI